MKIHLALWLVLSVAPTFATTAPSSFEDVALKTQFRESLMNGTNQPNNQASAGYSPNPKNLDRVVASWSKIYASELEYLDLYPEERLEALLEFEGYLRLEYDRSDSLRWTKDDSENETLNKRLKFIAETFVETPSKDELLQWSASKRFRLLIEGDLLAAKTAGTPTGLKFFPRILQLWQQRLAYKRARAYFRERVRTLAPLAESHPEHFDFESPMIAHNLHPMVTRLLSCKRALRQMRVNP